MEPVAVDHRGREHPHRDPLGTGDDRAVELVPRVGVDLLRVVQEGERSHPVVAQARVVEQDARDDERPREWPAARLVRSGHEPAAGRPVEPEQLLARALLRRRHDASVARATAGDCAESVERARRLSSASGAARGRELSSRSCRAGSTASRGGRRRSRRPRSCRSSASAAGMSARRRRRTSSSAP